MALYRPCPGGGACDAVDQESNDFLEMIETGFLVIFTLEVIIKLGVLAGGFFNDGWNVLDLVIVSSGYLVFIFPDVNTSIFRTVRVLRPLRSIGMMPGVRLLIDALVMSLPGLSAVAMLVMFVFSIFGVLGVQVFGGTLDYQCVPTWECAPCLNQSCMIARNSLPGALPPTLPVNLTAPTTWDYLEFGKCLNDDECVTPYSWNTRAYCKPVTPPDYVEPTTISTGEHGFCRMGETTPYGCDHKPFSTSGSTDLQNRPGFTCMPVSVPYHHGATSFNHIGKAMLILFQLCTTEGWTTIMIPLLDTNSAITVYVFFGLALVSMSFFLVNFVVAQMVVAFSRAVDEQDDAHPPDPTLFDEMFRWIKNNVCGGSSALTADVWAMRAMFNKFDVDGSGYLDEEEVVGLSAELGIAVTLSEMDDSNSGEIKYPQFERWWKMRSTFEKYDIDNNNSLDADECAKLVSTLGLHSDFQDCIIEMDQDESGSITYDEFVSWWSIRHRFEALDLSMDQSLGEDELEGLLDMGVSRVLIDALMEGADRNMDDKIDFDEFMLWWQLHRMFERFDTDSSWELEANELYQLGKALKMPDLKVSDINPAKTEKHGISFAECSAWWAKNGKGKKAELMKFAREEVDIPVNLRFLVQSSIFTNIVLGAVIANFVVLACDHHNMDPGVATLLEGTNVLFTIFFFFEMCLKMAGLGLGDYFGDQFNILDFFIVLISIAELIGTGEGPLSSFRTLRLLRVARSFKIFTAIDSMRRLLDATMRSGAAILNFGILLETFHVIFSLVGLHLFGDTLHSPMYDAPGRFDSFAASYLTCFQILTRENWHELLYVSYNTHGAAGFFFFAALITIGNFVVVSLFLGNLLYSLQIVFMAEAKKMQRQNQAKLMAKAGKVPGGKFIPGGKGGAITTSNILSIAFQGKIIITDDMEQEDKERLAALMIQRAWLRKYYNSLPTDDGPKTAESSLMIFGRDNEIRVQCNDLVTKSWFEGVMLTFIIASSIMLALEHPLEDVPAWIILFDSIVAMVFLTECVMKVIAFGFADAEEAYLSDGWNILDFAIVVVTMVGFFDSQYRPMRILRAFRIVRPLRELKMFPGLRVITEAMIKSMPPVAIVGAISAFSCCIFAVALVAMQKGKLYSCEIDICTATPGSTSTLPLAERQAACAEAGTWAGDDGWAPEICEFTLSGERAGVCTYNTPPECDSPNCYRTYEQCEAGGGDWVVANQNFNHIFAALLTLFELTTLEDWQSVMYNSIDTTSIAVNCTAENVFPYTPVMDMSCSQTFQRDYRGSMSIGAMFMAFILIGAFFFLNLFLGVVANAIATVDTKAADAKVKQEENTKNTVYLIGAVAAISAEGQYYDNLRKPILALVSSQAWDMLIGAAIVLNIAVMMTETSDQSAGMEAFQKSLNFFFTIFFLIELILKLIAYHPRRCFADAWNILDLFIVIISVIEVCIDLFGSAEETGEAVIEPTLFRTFRLFRLTRLLKLVPHSDGLQLIFRTFLEAMPMVGNVGMLLAIVFFSYSVLAVQLFGLVQPSGDEMNGVMNFTSFGRAWWTLFVLSTGEHWNAVMHELMKAELGPDPWLTQAFFLTFTFMCVFLVINLFVSVVVVAVQKNEEQAWEYKKTGDTGDHGACSGLSYRLYRFIFSITCWLLLSILTRLSFLRRDRLEPRGRVRAGVGCDRHGCHWRDADG